MTAVDVLLACRVAGLAVRSNGDKVQLSPARNVTPEIAQLVASQKPAILKLLRRRRVDSLQDICAGCQALYVDICGYGRCLACVEPANRQVA